MKRTTQITFLLGLALTIALIAWLGVGSVTTAIGAAGWGVFWLAPLYLVPLTLAAMSWRRLFAPGARPGRAAEWIATWIGLGVNWLLPVAQVGGELVKARFLIHRQTRADAALASVIVDKTLQVVTQLVFTLAGALVFAMLFTSDAVVIGAVAGIVPLGIGVWLFYRLQRRGVLGPLTDRLVRAVRRKGGREVAAEAHNVDDQLERIYVRRGDVLFAAALRLLFRVALVAETYIALRLLGHPVGLLGAFAVESLGQAVRAGSFLVPAGIGVQEGAFVALATAIGLPPQVGLALSLSKRVRELALGLPALALWQIDEGRGVLKSRRAHGRRDKAPTEERIAARAER